MVDGGLSANIPTATARALGADIVVAVDVNFEGAKFLGSPQSAIGILFQSIIVVQRTVAAHQCNDADVVIRPRVGHIRWDEMTRADELIPAGEEAARATVERIKSLIAAATARSPKWFQFLRRREQAPPDRRRFSPLR